MISWFFAVLQRQCFAYCWKQRTHSMDRHGTLSQSCLCCPWAFPSLPTSMREELGSRPGSAEGLLLYLLKAENGTSKEGCTKQAGLFLCRHVSSRQPGDSGSFLSFGGAEEFGNGLGAGPGAGTGAGAGLGEPLGIQAGLVPRTTGGDRHCQAGRIKNGKTRIC